MTSSVWKTPLTIGLYNVGQATGTPGSHQPPGQNADESKSILTRTPIANTITMKVRTPKGILLAYLDVAKERIDKDAKLEIWMGPWNGAHRNVLHTETRRRCTINR